MLVTQDAETAMPEGSPAIRTIAMPGDTNPTGDVFGGWLMAQMDLAAMTVAARVSKARSVTVAVEGMSFLSPVTVGDVVSLYARLVSTGRTSMKIFVEAWRRRPDSEQSVKVTQATFTYVAIDDHHHPIPLPPQAAGPAA
ncbi:MAG: acyl-CoA thioesterase [Phenylobacterium sp.]